MIDVHCHLYDERYCGNIDKIADAGLTAIICSSDCVEAFARCAEIANAFPNIYYTVGVHPHNAANCYDKLSVISDYLPENKCLGIGEIGLDYYYEYSDRKEQQKVFERQLRIAADAGKLAVVHSRSAELPVFDIIKNFPEIPLLLHCYTGDLNAFDKFLELKNLYFSVGGMITFKNSGNVREILKKIPLNKLLVETDSPYLAPVPLRGQLNVPANVRYIYPKIAEILELPLEQIDSQIDANFFKFANPNYITEN